MKVSDKDFDQLFSSKLSDLELEPSANVWSNIADELDGKKEEKRELKGGLPFMKIAAGIVVLMAVGLYFIRPERQKIELRASTVTTNDVRGDRVTASQPQVENYTESPVVADVKPLIKRGQTKSTTNSAESSFGKNDNTAQNSEPDVATVNHATENQVIAQAPIVQAQKAGLVPDNIVSPSITNIMPAKITDPVMANANIGKPEPAKKHKIHSLGDLLNVVIAKVDKREDKLIEFTNTSDEDSFNVTGLNLGLLKAKKEK